MPSTPPQAHALSNSPEPALGSLEGPSAPSRSSRARSSETISRGPLAGRPKRARVDRENFLTPRQILALLNAEGFAERRGWAFAIHITLHWTCDPDFDPANWGERMKRFLDKFGRWLKRHRIPVAYAWAHEVGDQYGEHTHLLAYVSQRKPAAYRVVLEELTTWIIATENLAADRIDQRGRPWLPVVITPDEPNAFGMRKRTMQAGAMRYLLEGIDPSDVAYTALGHERRADAIGVEPKLNARPIKNQRSGVSHSLGPAARRRDPDWTELRSLEDLYARLNPDAPP